MKKFKKGDFVRLKKTLKVGKKYGAWKYELSKSMVFEGHKKICSVDTAINTCYIEPFYYPFEMLTK